MSDLFDILSPEARDRLRPADPPEWVEPMLATLSDEVFSDGGWIFERKLDGERCLAFRREDEVRLMSRNRKRIDASYPELTEALAAAELDHFVADGEVVAFEGNRTSFSRLQPRMHLHDPEEARRTGVKVYLYLFDLPYLIGHDTTALALRDRKRLLKRAFTYRDPLRYSSHRNAEGEAYYRRACRAGWEGLIAKDAESPYLHSRSRRWLKFKCVAEQELVIGGYTDPRGKRIGFGALLVGYHRDGELVYAGKVGTGFDDPTLRELRDRLEALERETPPFAGGDPPTTGVHWVTPELVAQIGFTERTEDGRLRHPRFLGLRRDKDPEDVRRERP